MANSDAAPPVEVGRRDLFIAGAGTAALIAAIGNDRAALAQTPPSAALGRVVVDRRGAVLMIGLDLARAQDRLAPPAIIGLGKPYYQLEQLST